MGKRKIQLNDNDKLKSLLAEESLDDKFDSFYTDSKVKIPKEEPSEEPVDLQKLFTEHVTPKLKSTVVAVNSTVTPKLKQATKKIGVLGWSLTAVVAVFTVLVANLLGGASGDDSGSDANDVQGAVTGREVTGEPTFETYQSETANDVRFDTERQVASYGDLIGNRQAVVSQQQITAEQANDELFLLQVAQSFNIAKEFKSDKGGVFIGENKEQQVHTAVFTHDQKLVFIQIQDIVLPSQIIDYVNSL